MTNIIVALPKLDDAKNIKNVLARSGICVQNVCTTGLSTISYADGLSDGIVICSYRLIDMHYSELRECLPSGFEMLLMASRHIMDDCYGNDIVCLTMPFRVNDLIDTVNMMEEGILRRRRKQRRKERGRKPEEEALLKEAKELLMVRNHMTEEEAHRYLQKCSMDSGTNLVETAQMVLTLMTI